MIISTSQSMKRIFMLIVLGIGCASAHFAAGQPALSSTACECSKVLEEAIDKTTRIYAGFDDKVSDKTKPEYEALIKTLRNKALAASDESTCKVILRSYVSFFKDSHVFIWLESERQQYIDSLERIGTKATNPVEFKQLNKDFLYAKLEVFNQTEVDKIDSLFVANRALLAKTPYLIFDLRGNGGGNASTSDEMAKLIYTNPIIYPSWDYRSSPEYISTNEKYLKGQKDTTAEWYLRSKKLLELLKNNPGKLMSSGEDHKREYETLPQGYPQQVAFLIDKGCGSATEFYIFEGKQSKKVTIFGTNSHGVMDYGSDQTFKLCDGSIRLALPWGRNGWVRDFRIDNVGFKPDVRIPDTEKDWVGFVQKYYKKQTPAKK